jgi:hypothetical protein
VLKSVGADIVIGAIILGSFALGLLSWKWCLLKNWSPTIMILSVPPAFGFGLLLCQAGFAWFATFALTGICQVAVFVGAVLWLFYRDPERIVPPDPGLVVSPADGTVIYLRRLAAGEPLRSGGADCLAIGSADCGLCQGRGDSRARAKGRHYQVRFAGRFVHAPRQSPTP